MRINDKVVVVTGAGSGIGRAMSEKFVAEGARQVVAVDINAENAQQTANKLGCVAMTADVSRDADIKRIIEVETYRQRKTSDYDRWLKGMNRLHLSLTGAN